MAKKIPVPKAKTKMGFLDKLYMGIGGLSPFFGKAALHQSMTSQTAAGRAAQAAQMARLAKYGNVASKAARWSGLMNPWTAIPIALLGGAKYAVSKSFAPYKDEEGNWTKEGLERMSQERMEREERTRANAAKRGELAWMDDPNFDFWGGGLKASKLADYPELAKKYDMNEGGIARLL